MACTVERSVTNSVPPTFKTITASPGPCRTIGAKDGTIDLDASTDDDDDDNDGVANGAVKMRAVSVAALVAQALISENVRQLLLVSLATVAVSVVVVVDPMAGPVSAVAAAAAGVVVVEILVLVVAECC